MHRGQIALAGALLAVSWAPAAHANLPGGGWRDIRCFSDERVLPAVTAMDDYYGPVTFGATPPCPRPRVAAVAGVFDNPGDLQRAWRAMRRAGLAFGYPYVAPSFEVWLDLPTSKLAIVAGLFASTADANAWSAKHPGFRQVRVSANIENVGKWQVVQLDARGPVPAIDRKQARDDTARGNRSPIVWRDTGERVHLPPPRRPPRPSACEVPGDALFIFRSTRFDRLVRTTGEEDVLDFLPVECGTGRVG
jgi:hypothetical protein